MENQGDLAAILSVGQCRGRRRGRGRRSLARRDISRNAVASNSMRKRGIDDLLVVYKRDCPLFVEIGYNGVS